MPDPTSDFELQTSRLPAVSVLLPVRNAAEYLGEALESLAGQTLDDFEVVAVDDGSEDGSSEILDAWALRDSRFRVFHRSAAGLVPTLNFGLARCRASMVARMDADDVSHPERFRRQLDLLERRELDVVSCWVAHFPEGRVGEGFRVYERWLNGLVSHDQIVRERFVESPLPHPSVMARRRALTEAGGYRDLGWPEDYDLWLRLAALGARFGKVPEVLLRWRDHGRRLTRVDGRYAVERFLECKAEHLSRGPLGGVDSVILWGAGQIGRRLSKHLLRRETPLRAFVDIDPRKIGRTVRAIPVHSAEDLPELLRRHPGAVILSAVPSRGARGLIRQRLQSLGLIEGRDFWCVA